MSDEYTIFDDPEYMEEMERQQRLDHELLGKLWEEGHGSGDKKESV